MQMNCRPTALQHIEIDIQDKIAAVDLSWIYGWMEHNMFKNEKKNGKNKCIGSD